MEPGNVMAKIQKLTANEIEAANRAEATALLIRAGYRVYRPEADCYGEDLILRTPNGELRAVQLKGRPAVDWNKYGKGQSLWMLFPDPKSTGLGRKWFLVPHDQLDEWVKGRHGHAPKWNEVWSYPTVSRELGRFLEKFGVISS
jgi:hypothetical protein